MKDGLKMYQTMNLEETGTESLRRFNLLAYLYPADASRRVREDFILEMKKVTTEKLELMVTAMIEKEYYEQFQKLH